MPAAKKRKPQDAVVSNVKRLREEVRELKKLVRSVVKRLAVVERVQCDRLHVGSTISIKTPERYKSR